MAEADKNSTSAMPSEPQTASADTLIEIEHVTFGYDASRTILNDISLRFQRGKVTSILGSSGCGKTTLLRLLAGFEKPDGGRILIDGQDIARVTQDSLRGHIGMVTQDTSLLHRSMRDNITYGRPDATDAQMVAAAHRAEAHEFIGGLTDLQGRTGYDAHVGERGVKLSGGQRQRIAIARVMLKDAPILLLDEATSALDSEVEAAIQASLNELMQGKTVIAIAHRLSTLRNFDRIVVMSAGRVIDDGMHAGWTCRSALPPTRAGTFPIEA